MKNAANTTRQGNTYDLFGKGCREARPEWTMKKMPNANVTKCELSPQRVLEPM